MAEQKRLENISPITRRFLASGEGQLVDFKRAPDGVSVDDLVAFANGPEDGTILVGVGEKTVDGAQVGMILGCDTSDNTIVQLLNKAISCVPPISIDIIIENLIHKPILRVSVRSSPTKPHCTPKGVYCRRDGSRNRALHPTELLKIFLEAEAEVFSERFEAAAANISSEIENLEKSLSLTIESMSDQLGWADSNLDDTAGTINTVLRYTQQVRDETRDIAERLRALFSQDTRSDPVRDRELKKLTQQLVDQISEDKDLVKAILARKPLHYELQGKAARELTVEDGKAALEEASDIVREREDLKNYRVKCVDPAKCPKAVIEAIVEAVSEGGYSVQSQDDTLGAFRIGYATYKGELVATATLLRAKAAERKKILSILDIKRKSAVYSFQLSGIYLHPDHRNRGQVTKIVTLLLAAVKHQPVFAIIQSADSLAQEILLQFKFRNISVKGDISSSDERRFFVRDCE